MLLTEIADEIPDEHDLRIATMAKMIDVLVKKGVTIHLKTWYDDGAVLNGEVKKLRLKMENGRPSAELTFDTIKAGGTKIPDWTRLRSYEAAQMELKKQADGTYLLTFPNQNWDNNPRKTKTRVTSAVKSALGLSIRKDRTREVPYE